MCAGSENEIPIVGDSYKDNGCGCKPSSDSQCNYVPGQETESCFICSAKDLAEGKCTECQSCLEGVTDECKVVASGSTTTIGQNFATCFDDALSAADSILAFQNCIAVNATKNDACDDSCVAATQDCRDSCVGSCR